MEVVYDYHLPDLIPDDLVPGMAATIGVAFTAARAVGKPDPGPSELFLLLSSSGFTSREITQFLPAAMAVIGGNDDRY